MTCTVAYIDGSVVIVASDSAAVCNTSYVLRRNSPKIWKSRNIVFGYSGDFAVCQWIRYGFKWPEFNDFKTIERYLVRCLHLLDESIKKRHPDMQTGQRDDWQLLLGIPGSMSGTGEGRIFVLYPGGDLEEPSENYTAIGSGAAVALGALCALKLSNEKPWDKMQIALEAAESNDIGVKRPWHFKYALNGNNDE